MAINVHAFDSLEWIEDLKFMGNICANDRFYKKPNETSLLSRCFKYSEILYFNYEDASSNHCNYKSQNVTRFWILIFLIALLTVTLVASLVYITLLSRRISDYRSINANKLVFDEPHEYNEIYVHTVTPITCHAAPGSNSYLPMDGIELSTSNEINQPSKSATARGVEVVPRSNESHVYENRVENLVSKNIKNKFRRV